MIQVFSTRKDKPEAYPFLHPVEVGIGARKYLDYPPIEYAISPDGKNWKSCFDIADLEGTYAYKAPDVQPATMTDNLKKVGLQDGSRLLSTTYDTRSLTMQVISKDNINEASAMLAYNALQSFLVSREAYWICFSNWPQRMYYVKAKLSAPTFTGDAWTATVTFTDLIGLSRSINTSVDYQDNNGFGNNMPVKEAQYTFASSKFTVNNLSDTIIDPERRGHQLKITLVGQSNGKMKLTNLTTGNEISRPGAATVGANGSTSATNKEGQSAFNGTWVLDGVRATLNGKSDTLQTDAGTITLQPGNNNFKIENFTGKVTFDFPFWWLS